MTEEIWKDVKDYEGLYKISNLGRLKSLDHFMEATEGHPQLVSGRIHKGFVHPQTGYVVFDLRKGGKKRHFKAHRLVAEAFIDKKEGKDFVDHINRDRKDNRVENLRWVTRSENMRNPLTQYAQSVAQRNRFSKASVS